MKKTIEDMEKASIAEDEAQYARITKGDNDWLEVMRFSDHFTYTYNTDMITRQQAIALLAMREAQT